MPRGKKPLPGQLSLEAVGPSDANALDTNQTPEPPRIPEANEFSPGQIELDGVLNLARDHAGNRAALVEALRVKYFAGSAAARLDPGERLVQQNQRANNVLIGMKGYGLFSLDTAKLTPLGEELLAESDAERRMEKFARYILRECHGLEVLQAVEALHARGASVSKRSLDAELRAAGFSTLPRATTHHTKLLQWLRKAGVVSAGGYEIDKARVAALSGVSLTAVERWDKLTPEQKAYVQTVRRIAEIEGTSTMAAKFVLDQAEFEHGKIFRDDQIRADVLRPLEAAGWLTLSGVGTGRGGKQGQVAATEQLLETDFAALTGLVSGDIPAELRAKLNTPLPQIYSDLDSRSTHTKGIALELLVLRLAADIGLLPLRFRLRGIKTGGAEVDLVAEAAHLHFSRWLFQCKNVKETVQLTDLAKEIGMATLLHAHVIVLATRARFAKSVGQYAHELSANGPLQVVLLDGLTLDSYRAAGGYALMAYFHRTAQATMRLKRPQVIETLKDIEAD